MAKATLKAARWQFLALALRVTFRARFGGRGLRNLDRACSEDLLILGRAQRNSMLSVQQLGQSARQLHRHPRVRLAVRVLGCVPLQKHTRQRLNRLGSSFQRLTQRSEMCHGQSRCAFENQQQLAHALRNSVVTRRLGGGGCLERLLGLGRGAERG
eukprot:3802314-Rhodomonas_salina.1